VLQQENSKDLNTVQKKENNLCLEKKEHQKKFQ